jgi:hypothetical protein
MLTDQRVLVLCPRGHVSRSDAFFLPSPLLPPASSSLLPPSSPFLLVPTVYLLPSLFLPLFLTNLV